jgi:hypothetical protein
MSSLPGGPADKAGLSHESLWGVYAMLEVFHGHASKIRIEPPGADGEEFYVETKHGREHWQAKRHLLNQQTWTLNALDREGVLKFFLDQLRAGDICVFASISDAPEFRMLGENAAQAQDFVEFESKFLSGKGREHIKELCGYWQGIPEKEAFEYLRRTRVEGAREVTLERPLLLVLEVSFDGSPHAALDCFQQLYLKSVHQTLNAEAILEHLETRQIKPRASGLAPTVRDKFSNLTDGYLAGQRAKLIRGKYIPRATAGDIVEKLKGSVAALDIALIASAGGGKSGCLFQVVSALREKGIPVLAFRLDRLQPTPSTIGLGEQLGLPDSPAIVLARCWAGQSCVLVIDQLDFVSSTSGRHPDFFDTIAALIEEVRGLRSTAVVHLVLASRKFDFEHDHRLRSLLPQDQKPVELALLNEDEVKAVIANDKGSSSLLSKRQIELLRLPQNLSLFIDSGLGDHVKPSFVSQKDLFDAYWAAKQSALAESHPQDIHQWKPLIERITSEMSERQELSVPKSQLDQFTTRFITALVSAGVLTMDGNRYGFGHESLFDYCFARNVAAGGEEFVKFLEHDEQHLFRRGQLRQVLVYLRDDDFNRYLNNAQLALASSRIRSHLKLLVLELIGSLPVPRNQELAVLMPFIDLEMDCRRRGAQNSDKIASRAFETFFHSASLFPVADKLGYISRWLNSGEERIEDLLTLYLRRHTDEHSDRISELVEPFVGRGEPWKLRLRHLMEWRSHDKGRKFFDLFLRLIDDGTLDEARDRFASNGTFWSMLHGLSESQPAWCAEVAAHWLERQVARGLAKKQEGWIPVETSDEFGVDDLFESARREPKPFLVHVLPAIIRAAEATLHDTDWGLPQDSIWSAHYQSEHLSLDDAYIGACDDALGKLAKIDVTELFPFVAMLRQSRTYTANFLLQHAYLAAPDFYAEEAIGLFMNEPERLFCGYSDSAFWISRRVIEKCSVSCSQEAFEKLETALLKFSTPIEHSKDGFKHRGHASFNLASSLAPQRRSRSTIARLEELQRKFGAPDGVPARIQCYEVVSPISKESAQHMSDQNWLEAIAKHKLRGMTNWEHPEKGGADHLAGMFGHFAEKEPERFVKLALRLPKDANASYFMNLLYVLKKVSVAPELKLDVVRRVVPLNDDSCTKAAVDVLGSIGVCPLPDDMVTFVTNLATRHPDPERDSWEDESPPRPRDILGHGINTVRGHAARALHNLIWSDRRHLEVFLSTVQQMVNDKTLSVRACVAATLHAVARHDSNTAIHLFAQLTATDDRLFATEYAERFVSIGLREHFDRFRDQIERMLHSAEPNVKQAGGRLACLARLYHHRANDLSETALNGAASMRLGGAGVAERNLVYPDCKQWCEAALRKLFKDDNAQVRKKAAKCFWRLWKNPDAPLTNFNSLIIEFLHSQSFIEHPAMLLHALEDTRQQIPETTLEVCEEFVRRCAAQARDISTSIAADERTVGTLVFRSYAQFAEPRLRLRALSLIDAMCEEGLQSASKNLGEFER